MKKILIIEDDSVLRNALQKKLNLEGYKTILAQDGAIGLQKAQETKPDLILLDILMPNIDGMAVLEQVKKDPELRHIPVIVISNSGQDVEIKKIMQLGAIDYLIKANFNPKEVVVKVKKALGEKQDLGQKILIIEDDKFLRDLIAKKLYEEGYSTLSATDGEEGLQSIKQKKPDLVLLDILLPSMSGWEVLNKAKADPEVSKIPILLLTNLGEKEDVEKGLKLGAEDYIIKAHFTPNEIIEKVEKCLKKE